MGFETEYWRRSPLIHEVKQENLVNKTKRQLKTVWIIKKIDKENEVSNTRIETF